MCSVEPALQAPLTEAEIDKLSRVSRLPGLPEIAGDLYTEYCTQICDLANPGWKENDTLAYQQLRLEAERLRAPLEVETEDPAASMEPTEAGRLGISTLREELQSSKHSCIQGNNFGPKCKGLLGELDRTDPAAIDPTDLYVILDAFWEEADRRQFCRPVAIHTPSLLFHPTCVRVCILQQSIMGCATSEEVLSALLVRALDRLQRLSEGRIYVLSTLATSIRKAALTCPELIGVLHLDEYILRFLNNPPTIKSEFLFEVAAADKLQIHQPHRTYASYYGSREWHAYAALIDLLQRIPQEQANVAKSVFDRLLEPWSQQKPGAPIISKWKNVLQLQAMLLLVDFCVPEAEADKYLAQFRHALTLEAWPRYRFLLEWIIARIYYQFPAKSSRILEDLSKLDENSSTHIASLMKMAVLVAPRESEDFSVTFMTQLVPFSASPKVQIRHESNYAVPIIFDLALSKGWRRITENSAFVSLDAFIRSLDKFQSTPWTIRTLKLDVVKDFTLVNVFQGQYLTIESPEKARVAYEDFIALQVADRESGLTIPPGRIPLGEPLTTLPTIDKSQSLKPVIQTITSSAPTTAPAFFQTKSGFDLASLYPPSGPPSLQNLRPASVILVASLIDNPTNLGGLSRISESFGLEALYIADLKATVHKDFKATSVTSEKHLPIRELKVPSVPDFLLDVKREGYEVVGIEQTDQSGILGTEEVVNTNTLQLGTLPRKCVLVLGSEKGGISAEVLAAVDRCVEIRTVGVTRSLSKWNLTGACLVCTD
jgi:tRNA guanosine-2'-O-methyltransferase